MAGAWEKIAPVVAIVISLGAAAISWQQWRDSSEHNFLSTKPHVDFDIEDDPDNEMVGIAITNAGPGPAMIKSVSFFVDRKPVANADEMGRTYAKLPATELDYQIMKPGDTLAVGEKIWLISYRKPRGGKIKRTRQPSPALSKRARRSKSCFARNSGNRMLAEVLG